MMQIPLRSVFLVFALLMFTFGSARSAEALPRNSGFDATLFAGGRSVPLGGATYGEVGYDQPLWGDWQNKNSFAYGYVRPLVQAANAWTINTVDASLSIYPISILGFTLGRYASYRGTDSSFSADCTLYQCDGSLKEDYGKVNTLIGYDGLFLASELEIRDIESSASTEPFFEDSLALVGNRGHDRLFTQTHTFGKAISDSDSRLQDLVVAINGKRTEALGSGSYSQRVSLAVSHRREQWKFLYLLGVYESSLQRLAPAIGFELSWTLRTGLAYSN